MLNDFLPVFGNFWFTVAAFAVAISVIVAVHEYGHYIIGRLTGIHAEVFSLGFGPILFSRVDKRGTRWQLAAVPLGGYVKFLGDANAASVGGEVGARNTMLGAPVWARALTVLAGPVFNFILSVVIFAGLAMWVGVASTPLTLKSVPELPAIYEQGLQAGDQILGVEGQDVRSVDGFGKALDTLPVQPSLDYTVLRNGQEMSLRGPYPETTMVMSVNYSSAAETAGLMKGDVITAIDGQATFAFSQMVTIVQASGGKELSLTVWNKGTEREVKVTPQSRDLPDDKGGFETRWLMGVSGGIYFDPQTESPGIFAALSTGVERLWSVLVTSLSALYHIVRGWISLCNLSSPVGIAQAAGDAAAAGVVDFIALIGMLSAAVGFLNLLPIPILDGGHLVFHAYEGVTRRRPSDGALRILMAAGLAIIVTMMVIGVMNDLFLCN